MSHTSFATVEAVTTVMSSSAHKSSLPNKIIPIRNRDKTFHERWYPGRNLLDIPHPFRMVLASKPNCGKTTVILNVILRVTLGEHPFERIMIIHCGSDHTREYDDLDKDMLAEIPAPEDFPSDQKILCVIEDLGFLDLSVGQRSRLQIFLPTSPHTKM